MYEWRFFRVTGPAVRLGLKLVLLFGCKSVPAIRPARPCCLLPAVRRSPFAVVTRLRGAAISVLLAPAQTP
jgi:hypothetical protein